MIQFPENVTPVGLNEFVVDVPAESKARLVVGDADTITPPPKPDERMFYGLVGDVALAAAEGTEVNPVAAGLGFLSYLGAMAGRDVYMRVGNTWHHPRLFTLQVGRSGRGRKGDSISLTHRIRRRVDEVFAGAAGQAHTGGLSSREGLALLIHDGYKEGKTEHEPIRDKRLWVVESEFSNVLGQAKREGNTLSSALRDAWDGVSIKPATKSSRIGASHPHLGLHCAITPTELLSLLEARELSNGFANRFLMVWAERTGLEPFPRATPADALNKLAERTGEVLLFAKGGYPETHDTREMRFSEAARALYGHAYRKELNRPEASEMLTGLLERRAPYALRLAMLFALADKSLAIEAHHLEAALAWVRYARDSVRFIFSERAGIADAQESAEIARRILEFLKDMPSGASQTDIYADCFRRAVHSDKISEAIKGMLLANLPRIEQSKVPRSDGRNGKAKTVYKLIATIGQTISSNSSIRHGAGDAAEKHLAHLASLSFSDGRTAQDANLHGTDLSDLSVPNCELAEGHANSLIDLK
jgi:hypothetical protein